MASFRITLECGDSSCLRTKKTPEGYTHDWEVFVRGVDNAAIHHYIEKVVFNLHDTFPKPKRVIKEPPYRLKETGYAGFDIPIQIYLKNKNEPKKFEILYNLNLETAGPAVSHTSLHNEIIHSPSDEFRKKLLKGGATPISSSESAQEKTEVKSVPMVGKPKLSGNDGKKHRITEPKISNQFNDLFGPPIKTTKLLVDSKKAPDKLTSVKTVTPEKSEKSDKSTKVKHSPHKDVKRERSSEDRKEKKDKERESREKEKTKDKAKRSSSPSSNKPHHQSSENKRPPSPVMKRPSTPPPAPKRPSSPSLKQKEKDTKKVEPEKEKDKEKAKDGSKSTSDESKSDRSEKESKSERKKDKKKHKEDRDKEKKDRHKDRDREKSNNKESSKIWEKKVEKQEKIEKDKILEPKIIKEDRKSPKPVKEIEIVKEEKLPKSEKSDKTDKSEKHKESKSEKSDKSKHKHKKRDKKDKRDGSKERERRDKREKSKSVEKHSDPPTQIPAPSLLNSRISDLIDKDSSDSAASGDEEMPTDPRNIITKKELPPPPPPPAEVPRSMSPPPPPTVESKKDKNERKRDRSRSTKDEKESKKKRKKTENKDVGDDEVASRKSKDQNHSSSPLVEPVSSSQSPIATNLDSLHSSKTKHADEQMMDEQVIGDSEQVAPDSTNSTLVDTEEPLVFSEDYVSQLKELQQKIMTLQDNQELQRVVQVIAETGQYEITKKTFDFDLCALDRRTVQRLQQFFAS